MHPVRWRPCISQMSTIERFKLTHHLFLTQPYSSLTTCLTNVTYIAQTRTPCRCYAEVCIFLWFTFFPLQAENCQDNIRFWLSPLCVRVTALCSSCVGRIKQMIRLKTQGGKTRPFLHHHPLVWLLPGISLHSFLTAGAPESLLSFPLQLQLLLWTEAPTALRIFRCPLKD